MSVNSRQDLIEYCYRKLGSPVIQINVDPDQVEDRIDDALQFCSLYHFDGTEKTYLKHQVTEDDMQRKYLEVPDGVMSISSIFHTGGWSSSDMFSFFVCLYYSTVISLGVFVARSRTLNTSSHT